MNPVDTLKQEIADFIVAKKTSTTLLTQVVNLANQRRSYSEMVPVLISLVNAFNVMTQHSNVMTPTVTTMEKTLVMIKNIPDAAAAALYERPVDDWMSAQCVIHNIATMAPDLDTANALVDEVSRDIKRDNADVYSLAGQTAPADWTITLDAAKHLALVLGRATP